MAKISKKTVVIAIIALLVLAGTNFLTYNLTREDSVAVMPNETQSTPATTADEAFKKLSENSQDTMSILELSTHISEYMDKDVTVQGLVTKTAEGKTIVVEQKDDKIAGQLLDLSNVQTQDIGFNSFYKIKGKLVQDKDNFVVLKVETLEQIIP